MELLTAMFYMYIYGHVFDILALGGMVVFIAVGLLLMIKENIIIAFVNIKNKIKN
ncbi:hypothetical protein [Kurthia senegalensis]|uniref:hypothetical protein n=1 Tax=Kurthia senegalensis TaxID=1033740 RepID=UPI0002F600EA|nr:hypothetical protein [Kurthia senegalensis]